MLILRSARFFTCNKILPVAQYQPPQNVSYFKNANDSVQKRITPDAKLAHVMLKHLQLIMVHVL